MPSSPYAQIKKYEDAITEFQAIEAEYLSKPGNSPRDDIVQRNRRAVAALRQTINAIEEQISANKEVLAVLH